MILILHIGLVTNYCMPHAPTALTEYGWSIVVKSKGDTVDLDATALIAPMGLTFHPRE